LSENGIARYYGSARDNGTLRENNPNALNAIRFSDEIYSRLECCINNQNGLLWVSWSQGLRLPTHCVQERATLWSVLLNVVIIGPVFTDGTVTSSVYCRMLKDEFYPLLMDSGIPGHLSRFQQEGVISHTSNSLLRFSHKILEERVSRTGTLCYLRKYFYGQPSRRT
jgi:hypothetical protein